MKRYVKGLIFDEDIEFNDLQLGAPYRFDMIFVKRRMSPFKGYFDFPGGAVKKWESNPMAMRRELEEELGIYAKWEYLDAIETIYKNQKSQITFFTGKLIHGAGKLKQDEKELIVLPWILKRVANVPTNRLAFKANRIIYNRVKKDFNEQVEHYLSENYGDQ
jgi:8-oxo-dGTP pyrophosphatase MutT (NUDIX family)